MNDAPRTKWSTVGGTQDDPLNTDSIDEAVERVIGMVYEPKQHGLAGLPLRKRGLLLSAMGIAPGMKLSAGGKMTFALMRAKVQQQHDEHGETDSKNTPLRVIIPKDERVARDLFEEGRRTAFTTFEMPPVEQHLEHQSVDTEDLPNRLPYSNFFIREPFTYFGEGPDAGITSGMIVHGIDEMLVTRLDPWSVSIVNYMTFLDAVPGGRQSKFTLWRGSRNEDGAALIILNRLFKVLYERQHRFLEQPMSRQVRKSEDRPKGYLGYIVIPKTHVHYKTALRSGDIVKRLKLLEPIPVRRHPRTFHADRFVNVKGQTIWIEEHVRGEGDAVQVKDYRIRG